MVEFGRHEDHNIWHRAFESRQRSDYKKNLSKRRQGDHDGFARHIVSMVSITHAAFSRRTFQSTPLLLANIEIDTVRPAPISKKTASS